MDGLGRTGDGDGSRALDGLYRDHAGWLRERLGRWIGFSAADDVVQETYSRIALATDAAPVVSPRALLLTIARNLIHDEFRRQSVRRRAAEQMRGVCETTALPDAGQLILMKQAILGLPDDLRDVLVLSRFEGLSHAEIAEAKQITVRAVGYRLEQAMLHCSAILGD